MSNALANHQVHPCGTCRTLNQLNTEASICTRESWVVHGRCVNLRLGTKILGKLNQFRKILYFLEKSCVFVDILNVTDLMNFIFCSLSLSGAQKSPGLVLAEATQQTLSRYICEEGREVSTPEMPFRELGTVRVCLMKSWLVFLDVPSQIEVIYIMKSPLIGHSRDTLQKARIYNVYMYMITIDIDIHSVHIYYLCIYIYLYVYGYTVYIYINRYTLRI